MIDRRAELLKSDIDLGFTFVAVALTSYTAGNADQARRAAKDAQKKFHAAQKQLSSIDLGRDERRRATERLKNLEQVLSTIEAKDPGVFARRPSDRPVRQDELPSATTPRGAGGRRNADGS